MCGGGDDGGGGGDNTSTDGTASVGYGAGQIDPGLASAAGISEGDDVSDRGMADRNRAEAPDITTAHDMDAYVSQSLSSQGYSDNYKGVSDSKGNAVLDGNGNPVRSGSYARAEAEAESNYQAYQDYQEAREQALAEFNQRQNTLGTIDQQIIDTAMSSGGYLGGDFYNPDGTINENYDPTSAEVMMGPPSLQNLQDYGNLLGSYAQRNAYNFPGATFDDPYGTGMAPRLAEIDGNPLGSDITTANESMYFDNFSEGYNDESGFFGTNIEADNSGYTGFSTAGQRFGDAVGGLIVGGIASAINPVLGAAASGLQFNNMDAYGEMVPGYGRNISEISYNPGLGLGAALGSALAPKVGTAAAQGMYNRTGDVNSAITAGTAGAVGTVGGAIGLGNMLGGGKSYTISSDIQATPYQDQVDQMMEERGFGSRLTSGGDGDGGSSMTSSIVPGGDQDPVNQSLGTPINSTSVQTVDASGDTGAIGDIGDGTTSYFDSDAFINLMAQNANPNTTQVSDLTGQQVASLDVNPLFSAAPPGVQYMSKGRQRDYGSATYSPVNRMTNARGSRRAGLGNRLVGMIV